MNGIDLSHCTARPQSDAGSAYLRVAADPCGENLPSDFKGIPDGSEIDIVLLRMRDDLVLPPPPNLGENDTWGLIIFDTPYFIAQQIMVRYRDAVGPPSQTTLREYLNGISRSAADYLPNGSYWYPDWHTPKRRAVESNTFEFYPRIQFVLEDADFQVSFLRPTVLSAFDFSPDANGWRYIRKFRFVSKGRTLHLNAPATATQGRVVSGQVGTESSPKIIVQDQGTINEPATPYPARFTVSPPFQFNNLPQQDLNCRQDIIKTGSYDMQRHWNGSHIWNEVEDVRPIWRAPNSDLVATWRMPPLALSQDNVSINTALLMKYDGFDVSLGWIVTHIDGMSGSASIHMKHRSVWEVNVPGTSPWAANKMAPCPHDAGALSLEKQLAPAIPHSYEARYNDMGLLASLIKGVTAVGKYALRGALTGLANNPRLTVIDDPYPGRNLYGDNGFTGTRNGNGSRRKKR